MKKVTIIGAGLAGSEAANYLANKGIQVDLYEMRLKVETKAHKTDKCAELVCSNSLKSMEFTNAVGLLKEEMKVLDSIMMESSEHTKVPAGNALAVDRHLFSEYIDNKIKSNPNINFINSEITEIPTATKESPVIIASGPLTSKSLTEKIEVITGTDNLAFFDAIAPIFYAESLNMDTLFKMSRYSKGTDDYINIPMNKEEYLTFMNAIVESDKYTGNEEVESDSPEKLRPFEGCMPVEDLALRGINTPRFGPMKPKGLTDPRTDREPYAAIQLRQDDKDGKCWSMVGMQTRMKRHEQDKILRSLPGMQNAEFVRYGSFHRNTFIDSPNCLNATLEFRTNPGLFFAGQITGTEGYVESAVGGLIAGVNTLRRLENKEPLVFPIETATGALFNYISDPERKKFQPMNMTYGIMPSYHKLAEENRKMNKIDKRTKTSENALSSFKEFIKSNL